jgi:excisionase family DNA binding protein
MVSAEKEDNGSNQTADAEPRDGINLVESIKERLSPAVEMWVDLLADVIVEEVLRERRASGETLQRNVVSPAGKRPLQKSGGGLRTDQGQKVLTPRGRLLTIQEAADYLGISRASLAGRGWRIKNRLPAIKVGRSVRFDKESLDRWIDRHRERLPRSVGEMEGK